MKIIIIVSLLLLSLCNGVSAWHDGFDYRIPIEINNNGNPALINYQFNVSFTSGINESSIRVVNELYDSTVPHWCENETGGLCYELWFNVSVGSEINNDYYIYYGNNEVSSVSNYDDVFTKTYNDSGLVLELHMDEGTGFSQTNDTSGEGNHGTLTNMNVTGNATSGWQDVDGGQWDGRSDVLFASGDHLLFDGTNDYVGCGNAPSLKPANFSITAIVCAKALSPGAYTNYIISNGNDYNNAYGFGLMCGDDTLTFWVGDGAINNKNAIVTPFSINTWYKIVGTYEEGVGSKLYVDGDLKTSSSTFTGSIVHDNLGLMIGKLKTTYFHFNGSIDEVRIYNRTLSEDEIYRQYIRSKYAANTPLIGIGYTEKIPHPFLSGAYLFYGEMTTGLTSFRDGMGRYLIWGVVFFAVSLAFALITKIKTTLIGGK